MEILIHSITKYMRSHLGTLRNKKGCSTNRLCTLFICHCHPALLFALVNIFLFHYPWILSISVTFTLAAESMTFNSTYLLCIILYVSISPCSFDDIIQSCNLENSTTESFTISDKLGIARHFSDSSRLATVPYC